MSLESFFGLEESESSGSAEASEKFREQMRKNAKAIKAMGKHQKKQSAQEDKLAKILISFLKDPSKEAAVFLVVKLLQDNVPGAFILAVLSISDSRLQKDTMESLSLLLQSKESDIIKFRENEILSDDFKQELNEWGELIYRAGALLPSKTLNSVLTQDYKLKSIVLDLIDYSLEEYFKRKALEYSKEKTRHFALLSIQSVLIKLRDLTQEMSDVEWMESSQN